MIYWYNKHFCCVFDEFLNYLKYTWGKKLGGGGITILVTDKRDQLLFYSSSGLNFSSSSSKVQTLLDALARMALLCTLHKKFQYQEGHVFKSFQEHIIHILGRQTKPVSGKGLLWLLLITLYNHLFIIVIPSLLRKNECTFK